MQGILHRLATIALILFAGAAIACAGAQMLLPADASSHVHEIAGTDTGSVFDAVVAVAHTQGIAIAVAERNSGLLRLEPKNLSPSELDRYCRVPLVYSDSGQPVTTFTARDRELREDGRRGIEGAVELNFLVEQSPPGAIRIDLRSAFSAKGPERTVDCASTGAFEREFFEQADRKRRAG